jgi:ABC-type polysaccharide transport system permease subunit
MIYRQNLALADRGRARARLLYQIRDRWQIYLLLVLPLAYLFIFAYGPMVGLDNFKRALLLNALPYPKYQKIIQTVTCIPHFISTAVMVGLISQLLNNRTGLYGAFWRLLTNDAAGSPGGGAS